MPRLCTLSILLGLAALGLSGAARAQGAPRSMAECERLKNDLAYNQCLAMFGPAARNVGGGDGGAAASASASVATALAAIPPGLMATLPPVDEPAPRAGRGRHGRRYSRRGGRQSASFSVGGGESRSHRRHRRRR